MSLVIFEGFETHETLSDLTIHGVSLNNTQTLLTSTDANSVGPRGGGYGCWKGTSTGGVTWNVSNINSVNRFANYWPRILIKPPSYQPQPTDSIGTFGFAFFPKLTGQQAWSDGEAFFTPLVAVCDATGAPHFFIGINSSLTLLVYRWNDSPNTALWNSNLTPLNFGQYGELTHYSTPWTTIPANSTEFNNQYTVGNAYGARWAIPLASKFTLIGSGGVLANNEWNYIECKTTIRNNSTGSLQVKLNRTLADNTLDINVSNVQTTSQGSNEIGGIALGQFLGYVSTIFNEARSTGLGSIGMVTYYDDFYWCDSTETSGSNPFNSFLGPVYVRSKLVSSIVSRTMPTVVGASDLVAIGGRFSSASLSNYVQSNAKLQTTVFNVAQPEENNVIAACMLSAGYETAAPTSEFHMAASYNAGTTTRENESIVNTNRGFRLMLPTAPDGTSWTPAKLAATNFSLEHK